MELITINFRVGVVVATLALVIIRLLAFRYIHGIRRFNGPFLASFTDAWRVFYYYSNTKLPFQELHEQYGDVVRIGPRALSFGNPQAVRDIFGPGKNWRKVWFYFYLGKKCDGSIRGAVTNASLSGSSQTCTLPTWAWSKDS